MVPLEDKYINGITAKLMFYIIAGTISICGTTIGAYYGIKNQFEQLFTTTAAINNRMDKIEIRQNDFEMRIRKAESTIIILAQQQNDLLSKKK